MKRPARKRPASVLSRPEEEAWPIPGLHPYYLKSSGLGTCEGPGGCFRGVEYAIVKKSQAEPRANRSPWGHAKTPDPHVDPSGRCDLKVVFYDQYNRSSTYYHRVVALTLLQCFWDDDGKLLPRGYTVPAADWSKYEVSAHCILIPTHTVRLFCFCVQPWLIRHLVFFS